MSDKYFLVVRCMSSNDNSAIRLSFPPDLEINPLGQIRKDRPCLKHSIAHDKVSNIQKYSSHDSLSVLVCIKRGGSTERLKELACSAAERFFNKKTGKERSF